MTVFKIDKLIQKSFNDCKCFSKIIFKKIKKNANLIILETIITYRFNFCNYTNKNKLTIKYCFRNNNFKKFKILF